MNVQVHSTAEAGITHIYIYRTAVAVSEMQAQLAADAGDMYLVGKIINGVTPFPTFEDNTLAVEGNALMESANHVTPQFRYCVWDGNYFWGFGNHPFRVNATWTSSGAIIISPSSNDKFWIGRDGQYITFDNVLSGGIDNRGTFKFKYVSETIGQVADKDGVNLPMTAGAGQIVVHANGATLYRSAYRNRFSCDHMKNIAVGA